MANVSQTYSRHQTNVTRSNNTNSHLAFSSHLSFFEQLLKNLLLKIHWRYETNLEINPD